MKKVALIVLLLVMFVGAAVASADPQNGAKRYVVANVTCDDGTSGEVLVPAGPAVPGFFDEEIEGRASGAPLRSQWEAKWFMPGNTRV